jgi:ABC-type branched-subunit amino acid transport system substrate-binding protein
MMGFGAAVAAIALTATASGSWSNSATAASSTITVGGMAPLSSQVISLPEIKSGLVAAIDELNSHGGINGHPVKLDFCDTQNTSAGEINCMDQMISDKVSAVLAPDILANQSGAPYKLAQSADLASIGTMGLSPAEFTSPVVFPLASGNPGWAYGAIADLVSGGARNIAILSDNEGASEFGNALGVKALKLAGLTPVNDVAADPTSDPTFTTAAAKAVAGKVDGLFLFTDPNYVPAAMRALRAAGYSGPIADETVDFSPPILKAVGSLGNGIELVGSVSVQSDTSNPAVRAFLADMKKYQPRATLDEESENSWAAVQLYAKVMAKATDFSSSHVLSLMQNLSTPINVGVAGPYLVKGAKPVLAGYPRIFNPDIVEGVVRNGVIEPSGHGFVNPFQFLRSANHG